MNNAVTAAVVLLVASSFGQGQTSSPTRSAIKAPAPPTDIRLAEKPLTAFPEPKPSSSGESALSIVPKKWKHAETAHFILHYRRATEAQKVAREIEFTLWWVASTLQAAPERYARRSHVYIFEDTEEWRQFLATVEAPSWFASFARGDELFLNVRESTATGRFNFETLAHETTHAVVARLYPTQRWPLWLNEGFAEYAAGASIAERRNQTVRRHQSRLDNAEIPLEQLFAMTAYPMDQERVSQFYQTGEKFVRFLHNELPKERFLGFLDQVLKGTEPKSAFLSVYSDQFKDWETFLKRYSKFTK